MRLSIAQRRYRATDAEEEQQQQPNAHQPANPPLAAPAQRLGTAVLGLVGPPGGHRYRGQQQVGIDQMQGHRHGAADRSVVGHPLEQHQPA